MSVQGAAVMGLAANKPRLTIAAAGDNEPSRRTVLLLWMLWLLWLPFFIPMAVALIDAGPTVFRLLASFAGAALFFVFYIVLTRRNAQRFASSMPVFQPSGVTRWSPVLAMVALSAMLMLLNGESWSGMLIFSSACIAGWLPPRQALWTVGALTLLAFTGVGIVHGQFLHSFSAAAFVAVPGLCVIAFVRSAMMSQRLRSEREAAKRTAAVAEERLRIARDLHDLLGHHLSQIALKSELAEYLVAASSEQAAEAMREVASVARASMQEVRVAVAGYRQPTLAAELRSAEELLTAAGIACRSEGDLIDLPAQVESLLAWAVREGVTNVVKHSRARRCSIRLRPYGDRVEVEIRDDGVGLSLDDPSEQRTLSTGCGLAGLSERCAELGGRCEAGSHLRGGFRLAVVVPRSPVVEPVTAVAPTQRETISVERSLPT